MDRDLDVRVLAYDGKLNAALVCWLLQGEGRIKSFHSYNHVPDIVMARNQIVQAFLETDAPALLMLDNDIVPRVPLRDIDFSSDVTVCREPTMNPAQPEAHPDIGSIALCGIKRQVAVGLNLNPPVFDRPDVTVDGTQWQGCECRKFIEKVRRQGYEVVKLHESVVHLKEVPLALTDEGQITRAW